MAQFTFEDDLFHLIFEAFKEFVRESYVVLADPPESSKSRVGVFW